MIRKTILFFAWCSLVIACGSEQAKEKPSEEKKPEVKAEVAEVEPVKKERPALVVPDRLFGLPVPGDVISLLPAPDKTTIITKWDLAQVERFFAKQLVDYEVIRDEDRLLVVGLREYMSRADATKTSRKHKTVTIAYYPGKTKPSAKRAPKPKKGDPVKLTTRTGDLLAPGAHWEEPYTPPKGSPLDKPRYKGNFGTPFGRWVDN